MPRGHPITRREREFAKVHNVQQSLSFSQGSASRQTHVNVKTERVSKPVRVEGGAHSASKDLVLLANKDAEFDEPLHQDLVSQKVDLVPVHSRLAERLALLQSSSIETSVSHMCKPYAFDSHQRW